jgi:hypothetical protein
MRTIAISLALVLAASFASAQEVPVTDATVAAAPAPQVDNSTAFKVGAWLKSAVTAPVSAGKSFLAGLTQSVPAKNESSANAAPVSAPVTAEVPASKVPVIDIPVAKSDEPLAAPQSPMASVRSKVSELLAMVNRKSSSEAPAPVEDRYVAHVSVQ